LSGVAADVSKCELQWVTRRSRGLGGIGNSPLCSSGEPQGTLRGLGIVARITVKLHRCSTRWKFGPCWRVQKALDEQGIAYDVVKGPARPGKWADLQRLSGQKLYPVIEFENGSIYREESKDMAATIRAGKLDEKRRAAT
jgi:hypothetical protein